MKKVIIYITSILSISILCILLVIGFELVYGVGLDGILFTERENPEYQMVLSLVSIGDQREIALASLVSNSWHHSEIFKKVDGSIEDLLFYGPKHPDKAIVISITSELIAGKYRVDSIYEVDNDILSSYGKFIPYFDMVDAIISPGDNRKIVLKNLKSAWDHKVCIQSNDSIDDLFFFGNRDFDDIVIIHIHSVMSNGDHFVEYTKEIDNIGEFSECNPAK